MARQVFNLKLTLTDAQVARLATGFSQVNEAAAVQAVTQDTMSKFSDGGLMLPAAIIERIEKHLDKVNDPVQVAEAIEASQGMDGDNVVVSITLDPVWVNELKEKADFLGMSLDVLASELASQILNQGLLYDMETDRIPVYFTPEQFAAVSKAVGTTGHPIFGEDIARKLGCKDTDDIEEELFSGEKV